MNNKLILPLIVISQFCCTSLWFAGNAVMSDLVATLQLNENAIGALTSVVQFGFIIGTLVFAIFTITDRFSPSKVFFICALLGSLFNLGIVYHGNTYTTLLLFRFLTGFFLAGIYPVGMKIAADYFEHGLGKSLSFLVGALVLGTAFPHALKVFTSGLPWDYVIVSTSVLALIGGLSIFFFVPDGPFRKSSSSFQFSAIFDIFKKEKFRSAAFGYFGHMWELYTFWAFVPLMIIAYNTIHQVEANTSLYAFLVIGIGSIACIIGGYISEKIGVKKTAQLVLLLSCTCCFISPLLFYQSSQFLFTVFLMLWGMFVIADSPLFSTLVAQNAPIELKGSALTIVNCIGFAITIVSIQLISLMQEIISIEYVFVLLSVGPLVGLYFLKEK
ncbi:MFS transporter [Flammeovirga yaeyamensis]|uniref:MFS transporter n=1 Tax=Flammeovirga yaeyamensis TaxID=367791 RepID=A0AAX1NDK5_9BACT|nr:MFS transporter [Flammeovirga yaeyamensis]MBB3699490.1 MFS family permease [Flammeovirga yaeyamensis]NMF35253.1 MFS transporter [Flammeovirga yaeyamensis]QWG04113.1 MFS transporter [Flammeovirga yaeyamensis]